MLKIKDNVDLKELEKFGFEKTEMYPPSAIGYEYNDNDCQIDICGLTINELGLTICYWKSHCHYEIPVVIYNLIQAGLVEKVEENE